MRIDSACERIFGSGKHSRAEVAHARADGWILVEFDILVIISRKIAPGSDFGQFFMILVEFGVLVAISKNLKYYLSLYIFKP